MALHPITRELVRQKKQGFFEAKEGSVCRYFKFIIDPCDEEDKKTLTIQKGTTNGYKGGIKYRTLQEQDLSIGVNMFKDGKGLLNYPVSVYDPLHKVVNNLVAIIGQNGKADYSIFGDTHGDDGDGWAWDKKDALSLEDALNNYRFARLGYTSPTGIKLNFSAADNPGIITGELELVFPLSKLEKIEFNLIDKTAHYVDKLVHYTDKRFKF